MTESKDDTRSIREEVENLMEKYELPEPKELEYRLSEFEFGHDQLKQDLIQIYKARYDDSQDFKEILRSLLDIIEADEHVIESQKREKKALEYLIYGHCTVIFIISVFSLLL